MSDKRGVILMEALLFFMICVMLISILLGVLLATTRMHVIERNGYQDEEIQRLYEAERLHDD